MHSPGSSVRIFIACCPTYNCVGHGRNIVNAPECQCTVWLDRYTKPSYWSLEPLLFGTAAGKSAGCSEPPFYMVVSGAFGPAFGLRFNTNHSAHLPGAMTNGAYVKYKVACTSISIRSRWTGRSVFDETHPHSSSRFDGQLMVYINALQRRQDQSTSNMGSPWKSSMLLPIFLMASSAFSLRSFSVSFTVTNTKS
jgi:hypothetical protein